MKKYLFSLLLISGKSVNADGIYQFDYSSANCHVIVYVMKKTHMRYCRQLRLKLFPEKPKNISNYKNSSTFLISSGVSILGVSIVVSATSIV